MKTPALELFGVAGRGTPCAPFPARQPAARRGLSHPTFIAILLLLATLNRQSSIARAQSSMFTYQGLVTVSGTNFTGTGQFQFALVTSTNASRTATATAVLYAPFVVGYTVTFGGNGYTTAPAVTISGGGGFGALATADLSGGVVTSLTPDSAGDGYTTAPKVTIAPPTPAYITYTTYWSNDGTSVNGSEPESVVSLGVTNGLFTVVVGDPTIPGMGAISAAVFSQPDLQLRIWFNDGVHGFAALNPAQSLTPTPYAIYSANAGNAALAATAGSVSAANIVGTIPATQLPAGLLTNGASGVNLSGTFSGNGAGVTNVSFKALKGGGYSPWGSFVLASSPSVGPAPECVIAVDVNGDGEPDLISANYAPDSSFNNNTLTMLTNNGSGAFGFNATLTVGANPYSVCAADVNGDGKLDLISANSGANTLTVLTNNGSGGFGFNATLPVGVGPVSVIAADVNGDGKMDLICANFGAIGGALGNTLTVLTNNGYGVFGSNATPTVGNGPECVIAADVNGDGKLDLVCAGLNNALTVLTNNGSGVFGLSANLTNGAGSSVVAADVNGDGHVDLISANSANA